MYSSTNGGATWLNYLNGNIRAFATTGNIAFAASDVSIYLSTNNGISWSYIQPNNGFGYENIYSLAINGGYLYVGTDYGKVWKCQLSAFGITTVGIQESTNNADFTISPNPFTSQTTISFSEPQKNTTIKIMDVVGKEIKTVLFSGKSLILEKGEMQSGVYFVQITDEKKNVVNKKVVVE